MLKRVYAMDEETLKRIKGIEERLEVLETAVKAIGGSPTVNMPRSIAMNDLLALPSSLQKTMLAIQELETATTTEVAEKTGRDRTVETIYLNQLTRIGYLKKERKGRRIYFKVIQYY